MVELAASGEHTAVTPGCPVVLKSLAGDKRIKSFTSKEKNVLHLAH